ncbi:MAG: OmpA family protein [Mucilaginibacter polytrichastri]|nr:OmpA family protein [Mucilaginibacter polytrichastri]
MNNNILKNAPANCRKFAFGLAMLASAQMAFATIGDKEPKKEASKERAAKVNLAAVKLENVHFGFDRKSLSEADMAELDRVAKLLIDNNGSIKISGHADAVGTYLYNWKLSAARSKTVKEYLVSKGADESKIAATEFGDTKPIASNKTKSGRQKNRRVEMAFL